MQEMLRRQVWERAGNLCEYCRIPQSLDLFPFQIDHILALKHHGLTELLNLALCCLSCNSYKGSNIAGFDLVTRQITALYHPRRQYWPDHFVWQGPILIGSTPAGRVTVDVLEINLRERVIQRGFLLESGVWAG